MNIEHDRRALVVSEPIGRRGTVLGSGPGGEQAQALFGR
jgi:hypothetical protein